MISILITQIIGGYYHVLALTDDGKLYTWGCNGNGQLGIGNTNTSNVPARVGNNLGRCVLCVFMLLFICAVLTVDGITCVTQKLYVIV